MRYLTILFLLASCEATAPFDPVAGQIAADGGSDAPTGQIDALSVDSGGDAPVNLGALQSLCLSCAKSVAASPCLQITCDPTDNCHGEAKGAKKDGTLCTNDAGKLSTCAGGFCL